MNKNLSTAVVAALLASPGLVRAQTLDALKTLDAQSRAASQAPDMATAHDGASRIDGQAASVPSSSVGQESSSKSSTKLGRAGKRISDSAAAPYRTGRAWAGKTFDYMIGPDERPETLFFDFVSGPIYEAKREMKTAVCSPFFLVAAIVGAVAGIGKGLAHLLTGG